MLYILYLNKVLQVSYKFFCLQIYLKFFNIYNYSILVEYSTTIWLNRKSTYWVQLWSIYSNYHKSVNKNFVQKFLFFLFLNFLGISLFFRLLVIIFCFSFSCNYFLLSPKYFTVIFALSFKISTETISSKTYIYFVLLVLMFIKRNFYWMLIELILH